MRKAQRVTVQCYETFRCYITEWLLASRRSGSCSGYVFVGWLNLERMSDDDLVKHGNVQLSFCVDFSVFPLSTTVPQSFADNMSLNSTQQYLRRPVAVPKPGLQAVRLVWLSCGVSSGTFLLRISTTWVPIVVLRTSMSTFGPYRCRVDLFIFACSNVKTLFMATLSWCPCW